MKLGILGGSFDPPHLGHVLLATVALSLCDLDRVLVIPVYQHALGKHLAPFEQRLRLCELAFSDLLHVEVSPLERELGGVSRTLRLIEALAERHPEATFRLIVGADILHEVHKWYAFGEVERRAPLLAVGRAGVPHPDVDPRAPVLPAISSTEVREALCAGLDVSPWVPRRVITYIREHALYVTKPAP
jgi:nicotinate-nucleotide adenylyltransferase